MSDEASPRPWRAIYTRILDARGKSVCVCEKDSMHGRADDATAKADAVLIVSAVNERDRLRAELACKTRNYEDVIAFHTRTEESLRDLVRRMLPFVEKCHSDALGLSKTIKGICALKGVDTSEIDRINSEHDALIAEARAAIGEDAK